ncbi:GNAT family N-acetyltransferase [Thalassospira lucentensis]|uniref:GNAT family N-acetyltransferase n=1 Tax=Thalassospira lucentensis TaxID=168935 RepID=UPI003AA7FFDB
MTILETQRTVLRQATHQDAPFIMELVNGPGWLRFIGDRNIHDLDAARAYIDARMISSYAQHGFGQSIVWEKETNRPIGLIGFIKRDTLDAPDIGYAMREGEQGKGYAFEVCDGLLQHGWTQLGFDKLYGYCLPENVASTNLLKKLGLTYLRDQDLHQSGEMCSLYVMHRP